MKQTDTNITLIAFLFLALLTFYFTLVGCAPKPVPKVGVGPGGFFIYLTEESTDGRNGADGKNGAPGEAGQDGINGVAGQDGQDGVDGINGLDGEPAPINPYDIASIIDPCGDAPSKVDEVLLRMYNGQVVASFSDSVSGYNTRFSVLVPGSYVTTDGTNCVFTLSNDGAILY